ncbi:hypothetical protein [Levilactobacillus fuyuanensis]|uniref:DUF5067 domain-containing protein n=1 Tax=Levilactobacillus fuyuanensis TaxID=2486022 RepID=A0ABW4H2H9_9LACO|nr:hypothetical protein [Levilactobacillus fuyuanensis]
MKKLLVVISTILAVGSLAACTSQSKSPSHVTNGSSHTVNNLGRRNQKVVIKNATYELDIANWGILKPGQNPRQDGDSSRNYTGKQPVFILDVDFWPKKASTQDKWGEKYQKYVSVSQQGQQLSIASFTKEDNQSGFDYTDNESVQVAVPYIIKSETAPVKLTVKNPAGKVIKTMVYTKQVYRSNW